MFHRRTSYTGTTSGGPSVKTVNGQPGPTVVLAAGDVSADPSGAAASAQAAAIAGSDPAGAAASVNTSLSALIAALSSSVSALQSVTVVQTLVGPTISGLGTSTTLVATTTSGSKRFYPLFLNVTVVSLAGLLTLGPTFSLGVTGSAYSDLVSSATLPLGLVSSQVWQANVMSTNPKSVAPATGIDLKISIAALGASAYSFRPDVVGYYA